MTATATPEYDPFTIIVDSKGEAVWAIELMMPADTPEPQSNPEHTTRIYQLSKGYWLN